MKNVFAKQKELKLYNEKGDLVYEFYKDPDGCWCERTYDGKGNRVTYKRSNGYWGESTYDDKGNELTFKNSYGNWIERTYDDKGNQLTYKNSNGVSRGFGIPEYTMQELTEKLGNFKIKN